jgi:signal recognition particle receptor subunit beta
MIARDSFGTILVIDSTDEGSFSRAKEMLALFSSAHLPVVVAANKADLEGAKDTDSIRNALSLGDDVPVIPVSAESDGQGGRKKIDDGLCMLKKEDVRTVLHALFDRIFGGEDAG